MKKLQKLVHICRSYHKIKSGLLFETRCKYYLVVVSDEWNLLNVNSGKRARNGKAKSPPTPTQHTRTDKPQLWSVNCVDNECISIMRESQKILHMHAHHRLLFDWPQLMSRDNFVICWSRVIFFLTVSFLNSSNWCRSSESKVVQFAIFVTHHKMVHTLYVTIF